MSARGREGIPGLGVLAALALLLATPEPAAAYLGPGLGLGAVGVLLGLVFSVILAVAAIVWYPAKRLIGMLRRFGNTTEQGDSDGTHSTRD